MELMSGVCTFCKKHTSILKTTDDTCLYLNLASKTLFGDDEKVLAQFQNQRSGIKLCVLCAHKIEVVHHFVDSYKSKANGTKRSPLKKHTEVCFVCDKTSSVVAARSNSGGFTDEFGEFTEALACARDDKDRFVCVCCVFALNSWHNLRNAVFEEILKQTDGFPPLTNGNETSDTSKGALKLTFSYCPDGKMRVRRKDSTSPKLQKHLKECLKNHIPLKRNKKLKLNYSTDDKKILDYVPFVWITRKDLTHERKKPSVLPIRIKMSPKFLTAMPSKATPKSHKKTPTKSPKKTPARTSKSPKKTPTTPKLKKIIYKCNTCNATFNRNYLYQEHNLNHVKPDRLVVRIARSEFADLDDSKNTPETQETLEEEKCEDLIENGKSADELNSSDEKSSFKGEEAEENEVSSSTETSNCTQQDDKIDSTNNDDLEQQIETPIANDICKQNGDSDVSQTETVENKNSYANEGSSEPELDANSSEIDDENVDNPNTFLTDEESGNLKRKFDEMNETTDSNEDSSLKYPPRKKVRFKFDQESGNVDEMCTSDKDEFTDAESVDATNECE